MANEAIPVYGQDFAVPMTCANGTGIERGAHLTLSDPMTAALCTTSQAACAGFAGEEKIASDGKTKIPVFRTGVWKVTASGAIVLGERVQFSGENKIVACQPADTHHAGVSFETVADGETFLMELKPGNQN